MDFVDALQVYVNNLDGDWLKQATAKEQEYTLKFPRTLSKRMAREKMLLDVADLTAFSITELDSNPDYLNCVDGVFDTKTGEILPHSPELLMSKCSRVHLNGERDGKRWEQFLNEIQEGNQDTILFLQQILGSGLVYGNPNEEFYLFYGDTTRNGKSTLLDTVSYVLGDYAKTASFQTFSEQSNRDSSKPSPDLARLCNARFVTVPEPEKRMSLDVAKIKQVTGGNTIVARELHQSFFEYVARFKLYFDMNYYPRVNDNTLFASDRVVVIPFRKHLSKSEIDPTLKRKFRQPETINYIFYWLYDGLKRSRTAKFKDRPKQVEEAIKEYELHEDKFGQFIEDCLISDSELEWKTEHKPSKIPLVALYKLYEDWCGVTGRRAEGKERINDQLKARRIYQHSGKIDGISYRNLCVGYLIRNEAWYTYANQFDRSELEKYVLIFTEDFQKE